VKHAFILREHQTIRRFKNKALRKIFWEKDGGSNKRPDETG
jgi:hypothetical protein